MCASHFYNTLKAVCEKCKFLLCLCEAKKKPYKGQPDSVAQLAAAERRPCLALPGQGGEEAIRFPLIFLARSLDQIKNSIINVVG